MDVAGQPASLNEVSKVFASMGGGATTGLSTAGAPSPSCFLTTPVSGEGSGLGSAGPTTKDVFEN